MSQLEGIRSFQMEEGWEILVGKTARDNDRLSIKVGRANDFWFHVAGMPGSHVVARHPDQPETLPREVKRIAAGIAAFFSKARNGGKVGVHWTSCKHVSKDRAAPAGQVLLKKYEKITVEPIDPSSHFGGNE